MARPIQTAVVPKQVVVKLPACHPKQEIFYNWNDLNPEARFLVAPCGTKFGKALSLDTPIPTPSGWKTMGDLSVGENVFDEIGQPSKITKVTEPMINHKCYEVGFSDGSKITADAGHMWLTTTHAARRNMVRFPNTTLSEPEIISTEQIKETLMVNIGGKDRPNHAIESLQSPLQYPEKKLPIEPYLLGVWLGDGTASTGAITNPDIEVISRVKLFREVNRHPSNPITWNVVGLITALRKENLWNNKHIPPDYLLGSPDQRLAMIQGLMDTDGCIGASGTCTFDNTTKALADGMVELLCSFGVKAHITSRIGKLNGVNHKLCYRVNFTTDLKVFTVKRKAERIKTKVNGKSKRRTIISVTEVPSVPVKCIEVDSESKLFLAGKSCIPTQNSYGCSLWMAKEAMRNNGIYCVWIAPTYRKAKIGYRYIKAMLPDCEWIDCIDGKLEIRLANGSTIVFLHGQDAEVTIEGEAIDRFVIDETGKITAQVWYSLLTTVTQTKGLGIITGTPRGHTWYYKLFKRASLKTQKLFIAVTLRTEDSPFNTQESIEIAKSALPDHLFKQYYLAMFLSQSTVFGDLEPMWDESLTEGTKLKTWSDADDYKLIEADKVKFWLHPDPEARDGEITHGVDLAKKKDWTVFYSVNSKGQKVGYVRFRKIEYKQSAKRLRQYVERFFTHCDNVVRYDATGVGISVGEHITEEFDTSKVDIQITGVTFTNKSKALWVTDTILAIEQGWLQAPRIAEAEEEFASYEVNVTLNGNFTYRAPEGEHDDIVSAGLLSVSYAFNQNRCAEGEKHLEDTLSGSTDNEDIIAAYADLVNEDDDYFDQDNNEADIDFDEETA